MTYTENIQGWFNFADFYDRIAEELPTPCRIAEIGVWRGCSVLHMASKLKELGKTAAIYCVDTFRGSPEEAVHAELIKNMNCTVLEDFLTNADKLEVRSALIPIASDSIEAASLISDKTLDFVFFDSAHTVEHFKKEVRAWIPKIKTGSTFGGHDIGWTGIEQAVREILPRWKRDGSCWHCKA